MKNQEDKRKKRVHVLRSFLLLFIFHFFIIQPLINAFYPEIAERLITIQSLEENEEEEGESSWNRFIEEEILHSMRVFYYFESNKLSAITTIYVPFTKLLYACSIAEVHTPPPEFYIS